MTESLWQEILTAESLVDSDNNNRLKQCMLSIAEAIDNVNIPKERWLSIGHHMSEAIKRSDNNESLDTVIGDAAEQIDPLFIEKSRTILSSISKPNDTLRSVPEIILLAIHLQCANEGF